MPPPVFLSKSAQAIENMKEAEDVNEVEERKGVCHPRCFCQRVRKLLKTNGRSAKKSRKRDKECASH